MRQLEANLLSVDERLRIQGTSVLPYECADWSVTQEQELVARKLPGEEFESNVTEETKNPG
jgi:hypothetical protein